MENFKRQVNGNSKLSFVFVLRLLSTLKQKPFKIGLSKWTVVFLMVIVGWLIHWCFNPGKRYFHTGISGRLRIKLACWGFIKVNGINSLVMNLFQRHQAISGGLIEVDWIKMLLYIMPINTFIVKEKLVSSQKWSLLKATDLVLQNIWAYITLKITLNWISVILCKLKSREYC